MGLLCPAVHRSIWRTLVPNEVDVPRLTPTGRFSALRYPGGKGKVAKFVRSIILRNNLSDGLYVEPYAGGAAIAWELLITGVVRRVQINDISRPVYSFWNSVLNRTDDLCELIENKPVTISEWDCQKEIFRQHESADELLLGFSFFFLNRTNRSGILNGGIIGGREQSGDWKTNARYNKRELISRIRRIASLRSRIQLTCLDAVDLVDERAQDWGGKALVYMDPPYFAKGKFLYHNSYKPDDHALVASAVKGMVDVNWIVSYDDVRPIHDLYENSPWLQYSLGYSARKRMRGREAMFFSDGLIIPDVPRPLAELHRGNGTSGPNFKPATVREFFDQPST